MLVRRAIWNEIGGLRLDGVPNAFGDVDFCLRCAQKGYRSLFTPFATFTHHESESRGDDLDPKKIEAFQNAIDFMKEHWGDQIESDPYYNPNLTLEREDFTLTFPPRAYSTK